MISAATNHKASALRWLVVGVGLLVVGSIAYVFLRQPAERLQPSQTTTPPIATVTPGTSWQIQLSGTIDPTTLDAVQNPKKLYDIDLETPQAAIDTLHAKHITVICYFSAGTAEIYRDYYTDFPASIKGKPLADFPDEFWLDIRQIDALLPRMTARMDEAVTKGCDGIDADNVDGYANDTGFPLTAADQLAYNRALADAAHDRGLAIGLKNDIEQVATLADDFDVAINEQCYQFDECAVYQVFIARNKAVLGMEYQGELPDFCPASNAANYDFLRKDRALGVDRASCRLD